MNKSLELMIEEIDQIVNELNSLDYTKAEEDSVFMDNLNRLDQIEKELNGIPQLNKVKTNKFLQ